MSVDRFGTIPFNLIDKFGIRLYESVSAALSELVFNAYDANAENVLIRVPLCSWLATEKDGKVIDRNFEIIVEDDGIGMTPQQVNDFFLKIGYNNRQNEIQNLGQRKRLGKKGLGALSLFGICSIIEIITSGGEKTNQGYLTTHLILNMDEISPTRGPYIPALGINNGTYSYKAGTKVVLRKFLPRRTPDLETFCRQIARLFEVEVSDFHIRVVDSETNQTRVIENLPIQIDETTKITLDDRPVELAEGLKLPIKGWIAFSMHALSNAEIAGVRIFANGKLVTSTYDFGLRTHFSGEFKVRAYLVGVIHANWLMDSSEKILTTDGSGILWDTKLGIAFQQWGQELIKELGKKSWLPKRHTIPKQEIAQKGSSVDQKVTAIIYAINELMALLNQEENVDERVLQGLLEKNPWMINPQWTVLQSNRSFENMRNAFIQYFLAKKKIRLQTTAITSESQRRPDFVFLHSARSIELVEIKKPRHALLNEEFDRIVTYYSYLNAFLENSEQLKSEFHVPHITLVCDDLSLNETYTIAYQSLREKNHLERKTWHELVDDCIKTNQFLIDAVEADKCKLG